MYAALRSGQFLNEGGIKKQVEWNEREPALCRVISEKEFTFPQKSPAGPSGMQIHGLCPIISEK